MQDPRLDAEDEIRIQIGELSHEIRISDNTASTKQREAGMQSDQM